MKEISRIAELARTYGAESGVASEIHWDDFIFRFLIDNPTFPSESKAVRYYFDDGRKSAEMLKTLMSRHALLDRPGASLLEFAAGYGCVSRHLVHVLPSVQLVVSDIHPAAMTFAQESFGITTLLSERDPNLFRPESRFDCVFALSFFSHMPRSTWGEWLKALWNSTAEGGVLAFTTQGAASSRYLGDPVIPADGFWFLPSSEQKDLSTDEYGQTLVTEEFVQIEALLQTGTSVAEFEPAFWWGHQDLYVLRKP